MKTKDQVSKQIRKEQKLKHRKVNCNLKINQLFENKLFDYIQLVETKRQVSESYAKEGE